MAQEETKIEKGTPSCCVGCIRWEKFGKNCWYYWEGKKHCTMHTSDVNELARGDILI